MAPPAVRAVEVEDVSPAGASRGGQHRSAKYVAAITGALGLLGVSAGVYAKGERRGAAPVGPSNFHTEPVEAFTFEQFVTKFERSYVAGSEEYARREAIFQESVVEVAAINKRNAERGDFWTAGPSPLMDLTAAELRSMRGYRRHEARAQPSPTMSKATRLRVDPPSQGGLAGMQLANLSRSPVVRNQGGCGSCWTFASAESMEAYILKDDASLAPADVKLAERAILDCVVNEHNCGGTGGCMGATMELAFNFTRDNGIPTEQALPYVDDDGTCAQDSTTGAWPGQRLVYVDGYNQLPKNDHGGGSALLWALLDGPVTVAVAADAWNF